MDELVALFTEAIRLRLQGKTTEAQQTFKRYEAQAASLGKFPPQHAIVRHILFEAEMSSIEEIWKSSVAVFEESLENCTTAEHLMDRLEILVSLTQLHIYLKEVEKATQRLEEARALLARFAQGELSVAAPFKKWEPAIFRAKMEQIEHLFHQLTGFAGDASAKPSRNIR